MILQKNPEAVRLVVENLNGILRMLGFIIRCGDLYILGQRSDLLKMMLLKDYSGRKMDWTGRDLR